MVLSLCPKKNLLLFPRNSCFVERCLALKWRFDISCHDPSNIFAYMKLVYMHQVTEYSLAKTGYIIQVIFPRFQILCPLG